MAAGCRFLCVDMRTHDCIEIGILEQAWADACVSARGRTHAYRHADTSVYRRDIFDITAPTLRSGTCEDVHVGVRIGVRAARRSKARKTVHDIDICADGSVRRHGPLGRSPQPKGPGTSRLAGPQPMWTGVLLPEHTRGSCRHAYRTHNKRIELARECEHVVNINAHRRAHRHSVHAQMGSVQACVRV